MSSKDLASFSNSLQQPHLNQQNEILALLAKHQCEQEHLIQIHSSLVTSTPTRSAHHSPQCPTTPISSSTGIPEASHNSNRSIPLTVGLTVILCVAGKIGSIGNKGTVIKSLSSTRQFVGVKLVNSNHPCQHHAKNLNFDVDAGA